MSRTDCTCNCNTGQSTVYGRQVAIIDGIVAYAIGRAVEKTITPTQSAQTVGTGVGEYLKKVVVEPIPNNFGKITYDGTRLFIE